MSKSIESEQAVIGCALLDGKVVSAILVILNSDDFLDNNCVDVFEAISFLKEKGEVVDLVTVATRMKEAKTLDRVGGPEFLAVLQNTVPLSSHYEQYAKKVKHFSFLRKLVKAGLEIKSIGENSEEDVLGTIKKVKEAFAETYKCAAILAGEPPEDKTDPIDKPNTGLSWGTKDLDSTITPIERHHFIVLAAETKSGKTAYLFDLAIKNAVNKKILYITLEMSGTQILSRIARNFSGITKDQWRERKKIPEGQYRAYKSKIDEIKSIEGLVACGLKDASIQSIFRKIKKEKADLVVVDNMGLIENTENLSPTDHETKLSAAFARFCHEQNTPVVLVHHFKKGDETKSNAPRGLNAIRGSSKITHDADTVILCHRTRSNNYDLTKKEKAQFTIVEAADRDFGTGGVKTVYFHKGTFLDEYPD